MKALGMLSVFALAVTVMPSVAGATLVSTDFNSGDEGWTVYNDALNFQWAPAFGHPAGSIYAEDEAHGLWWGFQAPAKFLGNHAAAYHSILSYDVWCSNVDPVKETVTATADVTLTGNGLPLYWYGATNPTQQAWTNESVQLDETGGWVKADGSTPTTAEFLGVLSNLTEMRIRVEYFRNPVPDHEYLDNIVMTPEPVSLIALGAGSVVLLVRRSRSRK